MSLGHIQQEFQAVKTDWLAHDLWEWLKKRYTLQNTASKWATITSIDELTYATCKNMAEYRSKYYALKASIKEQSITIEGALKTRMLNNLASAFKTYLTIVNDRMQKDEKLEEDDVFLRPLRRKRLASRLIIGLPQILPSRSQTPNLKAELPKGKKSLLGGLNVGNVAANIWRTRYVSTPMKIVTSVIRGDIFLASMTATSLSIKEKLQKDLPHQARSQKRTLPLSLKW